MTICLCRGGICELCIRCSMAPSQPRTRWLPPGAGQPQAWAAPLTALLRTCMLLHDCGALGDLKIALRGGGGG